VKAARDDVETSNRKDACTASSHSVYWEYSSISEGKFPVNRISRFTAALALVLAGWVGSSQAEQTWKLYTYVPNTNFAAGEGLQRMADRVAEATNGELKVEVHLGGSLPIKATDITQAVGDNIIQMASDGFFAGHVPIAQIMRLPFLVDDARFAEVMDMARPHVEQGFAKNGVQVLGYYTWSRVTFFANKPLTRLSDLSGLKIRQGGPESTALIKAYGGTPITMGTQEVASALQQGVVNGVVTASAGGGRLWEDVLTHNLRAEMYRPESWILANKESWDGLSAAHQNAVRTIVEEETRWISEENDRRELEAMKVHQDKGILITEASAADLEDARSRVAAFWDEWAERNGADAKQLLAGVRQATGQ